MWLWSPGAFDILSFKALWSWDTSTEGKTDRARVA